MFIESHDGVNITAGKHYLTKLIYRLYFILRLSLRCFKEILGAYDNRVYKNDPISVKQDYIRIHSCVPGLQVGSYANQMLYFPFECMTSKA